MRLSEAILLGDSLRERDHTLYLRISATPICGCGLGGAWLAAGRTTDEWAEQSDLRILRGEFLNVSTDVLRLEWPWLTEATVTKIGADFKRVCQGYQTIEQLADYVRSIEPPEPSQAVCGEGPNEVTERAELLKVKA